MMMSMNEKKILFTFGCPNRGLTVERLRHAAALAVDPAAKKAFYSLRSNCTRMQPMSSIATSTTICDWIWSIRPTTSMCRTVSLFPWICLSETIAGV